MIEFYVEYYTSNNSYKYAIFCYVIIMPVFYFYKVIKRFGVRICIRNDAYLEL